MTKLNAAQQQRIEDASELYRPAIRRAYEAKASPRAAIKAFCLQCVGYVRKDITECSALACPLWAYRPYQGAGEDGEE